MSPGNEAKSNVVRSLAKGAGIALLAVFKTFNNNISCTLSTILQMYIVSALF